MALTRAKGINLPLLSVYTALGEKVTIFDNGTVVEMERYFSGAYYYPNLKYTTVYVDFDDTIIINKRVSLNVISFLFQCWNNNKHVVLLTKHSSEIVKSLSEYAISINLFSEIIEITEHDNKVNYIVPEGAIFIDNMYAERKAVHDKFGIPVYDVDQVEFLIEKKC